jgi:hypothetical protein
VVGPDLHVHLLQEVEGEQSPQLVEGDVNHNVVHQALEQLDLRQQEQQQQCQERCSLMPPRLSSRSEVQSDVPPVVLFTSQAGAVPLACWPSVIRACQQECQGRQSACILSLQHMSTGILKPGVHVLDQ